MTGSLKESATIELALTADDLKRIEAVAAFDGRDIVQEALWILNAYFDGRLRYVDDGQRIKNEPATPTAKSLSQYIGLKIRPNPDKA
jgi:hypothetical protein